MAPRGLKVACATSGSVRTACALRFFARVSQACATALQLLAVDTEPAVSGAAGNRESPSRTSMRSIGRPSRSAAVWARMV